MIYRGNKVNKMFYRTLFCGQILGNANIILLPEFHGTEEFIFSALVCSFCILLIYCGLWFIIETGCCYVVVYGYYRNKMLLCCCLCTA